MAWRHLPLQLAAKFGRARGEHATLRNNSASVPAALAADGRTALGEVSSTWQRPDHWPALPRHANSRSSKGWRCPNRDWSKAKSGKSWSAVAELPASSSSAESSTASSNTWPIFARPGAGGICLSERGAIDRIELTGTLIACWSSSAFNSVTWASFTSTPKVTDHFPVSRTSPKKTCCLSSRRDPRSSPSLPRAAT